MAKSRSFKKIGDVEWSYLHFGTGRPLFLFHGISNHADLLYPLGLECAKRGFEVVIPDLPGFGFTKPLPLNTYRNIADELRLFIRSFNFDQIDIYGHSMGGAIALKVAMDEPDITNNVFSSSPYWRKCGFNYTIIDRTQLALANLPKGLIRKILISNVFAPVINIAIKLNPHLKKTINDHHDSVIESLYLSDPKGAKQAFESLGNEPLEKDLVPPFPKTLIIWPIDDHLILYKEVKDLMYKIGCPLIKIKNENHSLPVDNPIIVAEIVSTYVSERRIFDHELIEVERP